MSETRTPSNRLAAKVCIITGTGGSIGREAALLFAREGALIVGCGLAPMSAGRRVQYRPAIMIEKSRTHSPAKASGRAAGTE